MADKKPPGFSESDRTKLDEMLADAAFEKRLEERSKKRREEVRAWVTWVSSILLLGNLLKEPLRDLWKAFLSWLGQ